MLWNPGTLAQWENVGPRTPALVLYSPAQRSRIDVRFYDCNRIARGLWIAT